MATRNAFSLAYGDVNAVINGGTDSNGFTWSAVSHGDIVIVPPGSASWNQTLTINKNIQLLGSTTVIGEPRKVDDAVVTSGSPNISSATANFSAADEGKFFYATADGTSLAFPYGTKILTVTDSTHAVATANAVNSGTSVCLAVGQKVTSLTTILDGMVVGSPAALIDWTLSTNVNNPRLSGLTISTDPAVTTPLAAKQRIFIHGTNHYFRVDNVLLNNSPNGRYIFWLDLPSDIWGVMDHFVSEQNLGSEKFSINHGGYGNDSTGNGDESWRDGPQFGTGNFWTFEDGSFVTSDTASHGAIDGQSGGRARSRHCLWLRGGPMAGHGTESGGPHRGMRATEAYSNILLLHKADGTQTRAGTCLEYGNEYQHVATPTWGRQMVGYRIFGNFQVWGLASGKNPLDPNDTSNQTGNGYGGGVGGLYATGTVTGVQNSGGNTNYTQTITLSGPITGTSWTLNKWQYYHVIDTNSSSSYFGKGSYISSNDAGSTTLNLAFGINKASVMLFAVGDTVEIRHNGPSTLDEAGMGICANLVTPMSTYGVDPHQKREPGYSFLNTYRNAAGTRTNWIKVPGVTPSYLANPSIEPEVTIIENQNFFNWVDSFDGTVGVGVGTISQRPATCTAQTALNYDGSIPTGVGFWATDEQKLYVSTATNTWGLFYQPYPYPHPLTGALSIPQFTSATSANFGLNLAASFIVVTVGSPTAALSKTGALPTGVTFTDNSNGTATIAGTATTTTGSPWSLDISATNSQGTTHQTFTLTIGAGTKIIGLSGNMAFGNVITNTQATSTLTITNTGTTDLTVTSITYPTGYTGAYSGGILAGAHQDVTVTFAPILVQSYNGTITVNSDKTSGTNTIAVTGIGSAPPETSTPHPDRERSVARRVAGIGRRT